MDIKWVRFLGGGFIFVCRSRYYSVCWFLLVFMQKAQSWDYNFSLVSLYHVLLNCSGRFPVCGVLYHGDGLVVVRLWRELDRWSGKTGETHGAQMRRLSEMAPQKEHWYVTFTEKLFPGWVSPLSISDRSSPYSSPSPISVRQSTISSCTRVWRFL